MVDFGGRLEAVQSWINDTVTSLSLQNAYVCFVLTEPEQGIEHSESATISLKVETENEAAGIIIITFQINSIDSHLVTN